MAVKNKIILVLFIFAILIVARFFQLSLVGGSATPKQFWSIRSIDVMKYSRDLAREKLMDPKFDVTIENQISAIASTGASHVALGVPYDHEFLPIMRRWVTAIRRHNMKVWFRGNLSGWEGWFEYKKIDQETHTAWIKDFILKNQDLFEDGDLFSSCPECENGGEGDPRQTGKVEQYRQFLVNETDAVRFAMRKIGRDIPENLHSMNGDVARLIMDKETTKRLGGNVVIDHYVATPEKLISDIREMARSSGGNIILGEFGAPIPDIHGNMDEAQQSKWVESALRAMSQEPLVVGVNYWTSFGGSTKLWNDDGTARQAVEGVSKYFTPPQAASKVVTWFGLPVADAQVYLGTYSSSTSAGGSFSLPSVSQSTLEVSKPGFVTYKFPVTSTQKIYLEPTSLFTFLKFFIFS